MVKVSVIVACYNQQDYLEECVDSIFFQSWPNVEAVVVDDASCDGSPTLLSRLASRHRQIVPVYNHENIGVAAARDLGIRKSTGDYITTVDADDFIISPHKIESEHAAMSRSQSALPLPTVAYSTTILVDRYGKRISEEYLGNPAGTVTRKGILMRSCYIPRDMLLERTTYDLVGGFDPSLKIYEDWDLKIRLARCARFVWSGSEGVAYRIHRQGLSSAGTMAHFSGKCRVLRKNLDKENISFKFRCYLKLYSSTSVAITKNLFRTMDLNKTINSAFK